MLKNSRKPIHNSLTKKIQRSFTTKSRAQETLTKAYRYSLYTAAMALSRPTSNTKTRGCEGHSTNYTTNRLNKYTEHNNTHVNHSDVTNSERLNNRLQKPTQTLKITTRETPDHKITRQNLHTSVGP